jgi:hypothetical protein
MNSPPLSQVDAEQGEGQAGAHVEKRLEGPPAGAVTHHARFGPAAGHVGAAEAVGELAARIAALVADQVDLDEAGAALVPLGEGAHRDLALQQAARLGVRHACEAQAPAPRSQQTVDGRRRHGEQLRPHLIRELELAVTFQRRHGPAHDRRQALAADAAQRRPDLGERRQQLGAVERPAAAPPPLAARRRTARGCAQPPRRVAAVVAAERAELVEHGTPLLLAGLRIALGHLPGDRLPLAHRQGHRRRPPCRPYAGLGVRHPSSTFLSEATNRFGVH